MCSDSATVPSWIRLPAAATGDGTRNVTAPPLAGLAPGGEPDRPGVAPTAGRSTSPPMSRVCQVTGRKPSFGNNVSHSHRKTRRRWNVNVQKHRYWVPSEKRWVTLRLSTKAMKTINKHGIEKVLADMRRRGVKI